MRTLIIKTDGTILVGDNTVNLQFLQQTVGGYIEAVSGSFSGWHAYVNEEGKLLGLPPNEKATRLAWALGWTTSDIIVGDAIFLGSNSAEEADVPDFVLETLDDLGA